MQEKKLWTLVALAGLMALNWCDRNGTWKGGSGIAIGSHVARERWDCFRQLVHFRRLVRFRFSSQPALHGFFSELTGAPFFSACTRT